MKKDSVNASFSAFHNTSLKGRNEKGGREEEKEEEAEKGWKFLFSWLFLRLPSRPHSGASYSLLTLGQAGVYGVARNTHLPEFYGGGGGKFV